MGLAEALAGVNRIGVLQKVVLMEIELIVIILWLLMVKIALGLLILGVAGQEIQLIGAAVKEDGVTILILSQKTAGSTQATQHALLEIALGDLINGVSLSVR